MRASTVIDRRVALHLMTFPADPLRASTMSAGSREMSTRVSPLARRMTLNAFELPLPEGEKLPFDIK